jgi:Thioredoxin like C-terminal domain
VTAATTESEAGRSPETYVGYSRQQNLASPEEIKMDAPALYSAPATLKPDQWALQGIWLVAGESATLQTPGGAVWYRFDGRDLHLVLGSANGKPVSFSVTLDGAAPGLDHGVDVDFNGNGVAQEHRLYQLVRQKGAIRGHTFRIQFFDAGVEVFAFTFG